MQASSFLCTQKQQGEKNVAGRERLFIKGRFDLSYSFCLGLTLFWSGGS